MHIPGSSFLLRHAQNPQPGVLSGCGRLCLGDAEQAVEMLKKHNAAGMYNDIIGMTLASHCKRTARCRLFTMRIM